MFMNKITEILNHSSTNKALFCFLILTFIAGCGTKTYEAPNLGGLYNTAAMHASGRNPVIVIPGPPDEPPPPPPRTLEELELERQMQYLIEPEETLERDELPE